MIVVLALDVPLDQKARILQEIAPHCHHVDESRGDSHIVLGLVGLKPTVDEDHLRSLPGVEQVIRIDVEYKLVSLAGRFGQHSTAHIGTAPFGNGVASIIAGPCATESYDQVMASVVPAQEAGATVGRGDAWKARTSPYQFRGLGVPALKILERVSQKTGLPFVVDVLSIRHLRQAVDHGIACVRIGARYAQDVELVEAAAREPVTIMLKRGFSMTYEEWLLMAEYATLERGSFDTNIILCERGIRTFEPRTRNTLDITAISWMHRNTHLPIIGDPSHAGGDRQYVGDLACALIAVGADGLMMDVHADRQNALVDGAQALAPHEFAASMSAIRETAAVRGTKLH